MPIPLFNKFGNRNYNQPRGNNILAQLIQAKNNPGYILDILLQNNKINQQQYNELQPYKNNPEMIGRYLINHGKAEEINRAEYDANRMGNSSM